MNFYWGMRKMYLENNIEISGKKIGQGQPTFMVAELSANHNQDLDLAVKTIEAACDAGADAIKIQTYTADTLTIPCDNEFFKIKGTLWEGKTLHSLYQQAYTPWEWHEKIFQVCRDFGVICFSTPFDKTAIELLESLGSPVYKIASFENSHLPLIKEVVKTGKPVIISTGMATFEEMDETVEAVRANGGKELILLKCTSAYPAALDEMNLSTIPYLRERYKAPIGLSDHSLDEMVGTAAVALGSCMIEKHFTLDRGNPGPDSTFSLEPTEFKSLVESVRKVEKVLGHVRLGVSEQEKPSQIFRRSIFVVKDINPGEIYSAENIRIIRPGYGLHPRHYEEILGKQCSTRLKRGTPLDWDMIRP